MKQIESRETSKTTTDVDRCRYISEELWSKDLWRIPGGSGQTRSWRVSPAPFPIDSVLADSLARLGPALLSFYLATNTLYLRELHPWVNDYLDIGKPDHLRDHARMHYQKHQLPRILRPDIILTEDGPRITELDSVPGGMGQLGLMSQLYGRLGFDVIGSSAGMVEGFDAMIQSASGCEDPTLAIVVSDESADYRPEMSWLASELRDRGRRAWMVRPEEIVFTEEGLFLSADGETLKIDVVYRFFELFDLKNIRKAELIAYAAKKKVALVTPPYKHFFEEKMLLALLHHPALASYWKESLNEDRFDLLKQFVPETWILDPRPVPPHAVVADFKFRGEPVRDWRVIKEGTQKERRLVIKPSGFSPLAWGARGVVVGHDASAETWGEAVERALAGFDEVPYVLQHFREGKRIKVEYYEPKTEVVKEMAGRVRLSPYYYVVGDSADLAGALATVAPPDKKLIHGMVDAVMAPCMVLENA